MSPTPESMSPAASGPLGAALAAALALHESDRASLIKYLQGFKTLGLELDPSSFARVSDDEIRRMWGGA